MITEPQVKSIGIGDTSYVSTWYQIDTKKKKKTLAPRGAHGSPNTTEL